MFKRTWEKNGVGGTRTISDNMSRMHSITLDSMLPSTFDLVMNRFYS